MLIAVDRGMEDIKALLEQCGYEVTYVDTGIPCDVYIYGDRFDQSLDQIRTGDRGTLLIRASMGYENILNAIRTRLITPLFE
ncbi:YkuS family protein [Caldanaerobius polysaccharolyticus]|uniref:YkuS family protein n=1 Tax=Caldanaerobius polysaccharolyticus TaxID=44256 RepID=UPI000479B331|nr:YkuS family protein [Caldanaerobius polysaccharolyticus]